MRCESEKVKYPTRRKALLAAEGDVARGYTTSAGVYKCSLCGGWHVTHKWALMQGDGRFMKVNTMPIEPILNLIDRLCGV